MEIVQIFLWVIYPYMVAVIFAMGLVWNCDTTELYEENHQFIRKSKAFRLTVKSLMFLSVSTGIITVLMYGVEQDTVHLFQWMISVLSLHPEIQLIEKLSLLTRMHVVLVLTFLLMVSFTKYINYLLHPLLYLKKQNINMSHE